MRLTRYLQEQGFDKADIAEVVAKTDKIKKECSQIIKVYKQTKKVCLRGLKNKSTYGKVPNEILTKKGRVDKGRTPKDTARNVHRWLNNVFTDKFGWPVRSGVPTTASFTQARSYGHPYIFFPVNGFKFAYSPRIPDLFDYIPHVIRFGVMSKIQPKELDTRVRSLARTLNPGNEYRNFLKDLDTYTDKDLQTALQKGVEIFFNTKKYYLVDYMNDYILSHIYDVSIGDMIFIKRDSMK